MKKTQTLPDNCSLRLDSQYINPPIDYFYSVQKYRFYHASKKMKEYGASIYFSSYTSCKIA